MPWHQLKLFRLRELPGGGFTEVARFLWQKHRYPHHGQIPKYVGKLTIFGGEFAQPPLISLETFHKIVMSLNGKYIITHEFEA